MACGCSGTAGFSCTILSSRQGSCRLSLPLALYPTACFTNLCLRHQHSQTGQSGQIGFQFVSEMLQGFLQIAHRFPRTHEGGGSGAY
jgi:hypothetical protein